ncbi:serine/threonine-protein kinase PknK [Haliangium sp.]|uniref:serine/threonine-protein kinase n=1 Tax=Haliangium sp. TaxID=2663208 RepID=UPI003D0C0712
MGAVFKARGPDDQPVAIKLLTRSGAEWRPRFDKEAELLSVLVHPHIVRYLDRGVTELDQPFLVMEWLDGHDLEDLLRLGALGVEDTLRLGECVASALAFAHSRDVVHRDVKPANILLPGRRVMEAKLLDFGVARWIGTATQTKTGARVGTLAYMAPEQVRADRGIDRRADIFSLGCVLFECLAGEAPFMARDAVALQFKILFAEPPWLCDLRAEVPEGFASLIAHMLIKDPGRRIDSCDGVMSEIARLRAELVAQEPSSQPASAPPARITAVERRLVSVLVASLVATHRATPAPSQTDHDSDADTEVGDGNGPAEAGVITLRERLPIAQGTTPPAQPSSSDRALTWPETRSPTPVPAAPGTDPLIRWGTNTDVSRASPLVAHMEALRPRLRKLGADVGVLRDGTLMALLDSAGVPSPRTAVDQAINAARLAQEIGRVLPDARMAIATGQAEVHQDQVLGEAIERAVELLSAAAPAGEGAPGEVSVCLDELTATLVRSRFALRRSSAGVYLLDREHAGLAWSHRAENAPFVGRNKELRILRAALAECVEEGIARTLLITGEAGLGKSRLAAEFLTELERGHDGEAVEIWLANGDLLYTGTPLSTIAAALRSAIGGRAGAPPDDQRAALDEFVRARIEDPTEAARVALFLGELLDLPDPDPGADPVQLRAARADATLMGAQVRRALADIFEAAARRGPLAIVIDDLHWADTASIELLGRTVNRLSESPLLLLGLARPDVDERFPVLRRNLGATIIPLNPLVRRAAVKLVQAQLGDEVDPGALFDQSGGNPFYLEELVRSRAAGLVALPQTIMATVQARLAALPAQARRVLRAGSTFGRRFWRGGVLSLLGGDEVVDEWLPVLIREQLVVAVAEARFGDEHEFEFRHALVQEGAYSTFIEEDRQLAHRLAGAWLEHIGERDPRVVAEHYDRGGRLDRAAGFYAAAAELALGRNDFDAAVVLAGRGVTCGAKGDTRGRLDRVLMEEQIWRGNNAAVVRLAASARRYLAPGSVAWYDVSGELALAALKTGEIDRLLALVDELRTRQGSREARAGWLRAIAKVTQALLYSGHPEQATPLFAVLDIEAGTLDRVDPMVAAAVHFTRSAHADLVLNDRELLLDELEHCVALYEQIGDLRQACLQRRNIGYAAIELGLYDEGEGHLRAALAGAEAAGLESVVYGTLMELSRVHLHRGELEQARRLATQVRDWFTDQGDPRLSAHAGLDLATVLVAMGRLEPALAEARRVLVQVATIPPLRPRALATLARIHLRLSHPDRALAAAAEAAALLSTVDSAEGGETLIHLVHAEALDANGDRPGALRVVARAYDRLMSHARRIRRSDWRHRFLEDIPENAHIVRLFEHWSPDQT